MAREWKELIDRGGETNFGANVFVVFWLVLTTFSLLSAIIFSCADGAVARDKDAAADSSVYVGGPSGCAATCGAACGILIQRQTIDNGQQKVSRHALHTHSATLEQQFDSPSKEGKEEEEATSAGENRAEEEEVEAFRSMSAAAQFME